LYDAVKLSTAHADELAAAIEMNDPAAMICLRSALFMVSSQTS
jgi:hypothetical protein